MLRKLAWVGAVAVSISFVGCGGGGNDGVSHALAEDSTSIAYSQNHRIALWVDGGEEERINSKVKILDIFQIGNLDYDWGKELASHFLSNKTPILFKIEADAEYYATLLNPCLNVNLDLKEKVSTEKLEVKRVNVDADGKISFESSIEEWVPSEFYKYKYGSDTYFNVVAGAPALSPGYYIVEVSSDVFAPNMRSFDPTLASTVADDASVATDSGSAQETE